MPTKTYDGTAVDVDEQGFFADPSQWREALAPEIAVNCVAPGMIDSGEGMGDAPLAERLAQRTPMKRNGTAPDVVSAVMYFATAPHFITGQILTVDGGLGLG